MKLNCRPGDLAVIVRSAAGNEGKIVQCIEVVLSNGTWGFGPRWVTVPGVMGTHGPQLPLDACMRPLRDSDGEDEVLRLVGRPVGAPQAA